MFENKIVYLDKLTSSQKEFNEVICSDPKLTTIDQSAANSYVENLGCCFITILSPLYPNNLKLESNPPWILYYRGNLDLFRFDSIGICGCDQPTKMGLNVVSEIMRSFDPTKVVIAELKHGICNQAIISGLVHNKNAIVLVDSVEEIRSGGYFVDRVIKNNLVVTPNIEQIQPKHALESFVFKMSNQTIEINLGQFEAFMANKNF